MFSGTTNKEVNANVHTNPITRLIKGKTRMFTMSSEKIVGWYQGTLRLAPSNTVHITIRLADITSMAVSKDDKLLLIGDSNGNILTYGTLDGHTYTISEFLIGDSTSIADIRTIGSNVMMSASAGRLTLRKTD